MTDATVTLSDPVLNGPYDEPSRHFELAPNGPTGLIVETRRPSEFFVPIPKPKKGRGKASETAPTLDFASLTDEKVERNDKIDQLRDALRDWRLQNYPGVTAISRKLLLHWSDQSREDRTLFAQREAAETAIYVAEVVGRDKYDRSGLAGIDWRDTLAAANAEHNAGLPRVALKMATGAGKTIVVAMLIAWHTLNKVASPQDSRFVKRFLVANMTQRSGSDRPLRSLQVSPRKDSHRWEREAFWPTPCAVTPWGYSERSTSNDSV